MLDLSPWEKNKCLGKNSEHHTDRFNMSANQVLSCSPSLSGMIRFQASVEDCQYTRKKGKKKYIKGFNPRD